MDTTASRQRSGPRRRRPTTSMMGRDFLLLLAAMLGTSSSYAPMLSVAPLWSAEGGSGHGGAGSATAVTMAATVCVQLVMPLLMRRYRLRKLLAVGALLLGLPTFAYAASAELGWVLGVSAVRGAGFGMVAVAGSALVAELVPLRERGRAAGRYGAAVGLPQVLVLPLSVWAAQEFGFGVVFAVTGVLSAAAAPLAWLISGKRIGETTGETTGETAGETAGEATSSATAGDGDPLPASGVGSAGTVPRIARRDRADSAVDGERADDGPARRERAAGPVSRVRPARSGRSRRTGTPLRPLAGPWTAMLLISCALGGVTSFLPLALAGGMLAPTALFVLSAAMITGRWAAGIFSDRAGSGRLLVPSVVACALGTGGFALAVQDLPGQAVLAIAGAALYGAGFGALQNDTLVVMFRRAGPGGHSTASTVWNTAFDAGTGVGALAVGFAAPTLGVGGALAAVAVLIAALLPLARRDSAAERSVRQAPSPNRP